MTDREDSYVLPSKPGLSEKFKMTGNEVPVPLAKVVAESLRGFIKFILHNDLFLEVKFKILWLNLFIFLYQDLLAFSIV